MVYSPIKCYLPVVAVGEGVGWIDTDGVGIGTTTASVVDGIIELYDKVGEISSDKIGEKNIYLVMCYAKSTDIDLREEIAIQYNPSRKKLPHQKLRHFVFHCFITIG